MAQIGTFATTAANVSVDADAREITIQNEVVEIDGVLDPPTGYDDWGGWTIRCSSSGGLRSVSGASGTLGGGEYSLKIIEDTNAHRYGGDNFQGQAARFSGDGTNLLKYHNVVWIIDTGSRSDFDIHRGSTADGSNGPKVEFSGVSVLQLTASGQTAHYNHYAGRASIRVHSSLGFGLRIENRTNGTGIEFSTPIQDGAVVDGLEVVQVASPTNYPNGARVAVRLNSIAANGTMTLTNLDTPSIAAVDGGTDRRLLLVDPVGLPTRANWSNQYHGNFEIVRSVPFEFLGAAVPASATMHAVAQTAGGADATATMSGTSGTMQVRTHYSADGASGGAWTTQNTYRFYMAALDMQKWSLTTTQTIANDPVTISTLITLDRLPDGTAISSVSMPAASTGARTLSEVVRIVKDFEVANPVHASFPVTPLVYVEGTAVKVNAGYGVLLRATGATLFGIGPHVLHGNEVEVKCASSLGTGTHGLTTLEASGTGKSIRADGVTEAADVYLLDSTGQKTNVSVVNGLGSSALFSVGKISDGSIVGSSTINSGTTGSISIGTKGLGAGYRVVAKRPGYEWLSVGIDLTGGGARSVSANATRQIKQPDGSASYLSTADTSDIDVEDMSVAGAVPAMRIGLGNETFTAGALFKAVEDFLATSSGARFMVQAGGQPTYIKDSLKGDQFYLGAHSKVRRHATQNSNAAVRASLFAEDHRPIDSTRGDVQTIEGIDVPTLARQFLVTEDLDTEAVGTQSVWGVLTSIKATVESAPSAPSTAAIAEAVNALPIWGSGSSMPAPTGESQSVIFITTTGVANGDRLRVDNAGGYTGLAQEQVVYAHVLSDGFLGLFDTRESAIGGNTDDRIMMSGGTGTALRFTRYSYLTNLGAAVGDARAGSLDLLGSDFVEDGIPLKDALQITLAILAGKLTIESEGATLTFHRMDAAETAVIRADASDLGRTAPTRDPT